MEFQSVVEVIGKVIDAAGVAAIVIGAIAATVFAIDGIFKRKGGVYQSFRRFLGRSILLGLELLVAADIIRTVAITPTLESVAVLGGIVLIRTFLSFSLEVEMTGRWPWQSQRQPVTSTPTSDPPTTTTGPAAE